MADGVAIRGRGFAYDSESLVGAAVVLPAHRMLAPVLAKNPGLRTRAFKIVKQVIRRGVLRGACGHGELGERSSSRETKLATGDLRLLPAYYPDIVVLLRSQSPESVIAYASPFASAVTIGIIEYFKPARRRGGDNKVHRRTRSRIHKSQVAVHIGFLSADHRGSSHKQKPEQKTRGHNQNARYVQGLGDSIPNVGHRTRLAPKAIPRFFQTRCFHLQDRLESGRSYGSDRLFQVPSHFTSTTSFLQAERIVRKSRTARHDKGPQPKTRVADGQASLN